MKKNERVTSYKGRVSSVCLSWKGKPQGKNLRSSFGTKMCFLFPKLNRRSRESPKFAIPRPHDRYVVSCAPAISHTAIRSWRSAWLRRFMRGGSGFGSRALWRFYVSTNRMAVLISTQLSGVFCRFLALYTMESNCGVMTLLYFPKVEEK